MADEKITKPGRPTNLTPEITANIVKSIEDGEYTETAAAKAGIAKSALFAWLKRGARAKSGIHRDFLDSVDRAKELCEKRHLDVIDKAAFGYDETQATVSLDKDGNQIGPRQLRITKKLDWRAAAWRLRYLNRTRYNDARADDDSISPEALNEFVFTLVEILQEKLDGDKAKEIIEAIQDQLPGGDDADYLVQRRVEIVYQGNGSNSHAELSADPYLPTLPPSQQHFASEIPGLGLRPKIGEDPLGGGNGGQALPEET